RERLDVDRRELYACRVERSSEVVDRLAIGRGQDHPVRDRTIVTRARTYDVVIQDCLVHWDRQRLVRAERDGVRKLPLVVDAVDVEDADSDPVRADAEPHVLAR